MRDNALTPVSRRSLATHGDPFAALRQQVDRLFEDFFPPGSALGPAGFSPALDYSETDKDVIVRAELPGVAEKDIDVSVEGPVLTIKGEKRSEHEDRGENRHVVERSYGAFSRMVRLPFEPRDADIRASFANGVLTVTAAKPAELARGRTRIPIGKA